MSKIGNQLLHSDDLIATFLRSGVSSQISGWTDMLVSFALYAWVNLAPWLASTLGAVAGGIVNCIINYKFTFHAEGCSKRAIIVKYAMVWLGSVTLNAWGTEALYWLLQHWPWLEEIGFKPDGYFAAARIVVSLAVSWFWNFVLQRYFVYRPTRFDPVAIRMLDALGRPFGK